MEFHNSVFDGKAGFQKKKVFVVTKGKAGFQKKKKKKSIHSGSVTWCRSYFERESSFAMEIYNSVFDCKAGFQKKSD